MAKTIAVKNDGTFRVSVTMKEDAVAQFVGATKEDSARYTITAWPRVPSDNISPQKVTFTCGEQHELAREIVSRLKKDKTAELVVSASAKDSLSVSGIRIDNVEYEVTAVEAQ